MGFLYMLVTKDVKVFSTKMAKKGNIFSPSIIPDCSDVEKIYLPFYVIQKPQMYNQYNVHKSMVWEHYEIFVILLKLNETDLTTT